MNRLLEDNLEFKAELRVRVVKDEDLAEVEFRNTLISTGRRSLLCKIHLPIQNIPLAVSRFRFRFQITKLHTLLSYHFFIFATIKPS